jgi:serine/threonine protein phosphatase 1
MLKDLFRKRAPAAVAQDARAPDGVEIYAVGDIHGRLDLLDAMIARIEAERSRVPDVRTVVVILGDMVDRGPQSREVVDRLIAWGREGSVELHVLCGNHEATLLEFLRDPAVGPSWADYGGGDTLRSYGVRPPASRRDLAGWEAAQQAFGLTLPPEHVAFFERLETILVLGGYAFVHAGLRPGVPLHEQAERDLLWIRDEFLQFRGAWEKVVVHGHTPAGEPQDCGAYRIGVDTGAYATGVLTAVKLFGAERQFIQARARAD